MTPCTGRGLLTTELVPNGKLRPVDVAHTGLLMLLTHSIDYTVYVCYNTSRALAKILSPLVGTTERHLKKGLQHIHDKDHDRRKYSIRIM